MSAPLSGRINIGSIRAITTWRYSPFSCSLQGSHTLNFCFGPGTRSGQATTLRSNTSTTTGRQIPKSARNARPEDAPKGPLQIIISIADQRVSLFDNGTLIARSSVSTGTPGHPTPLGVFSVIGKQRWHRSNIYSAAPMPYMQRITWSGIALHAGVVPGHPASHGCIRLKNDFAVRLWHLTKRGTRVIIAHGDVQPVEITNPHLFKPKAASGSPEFQAGAAAGNSIGTEAATQDRQRPTLKLRKPPVFRFQARLPREAAPKKIVPVSVFVSRKLGKLFVRRGFSPLFDVPVKIENPEEPLGTHVFTAMEFQNEGAAIRWTVVSIPKEIPRMSEAAPKEREASAQQTALSATVAR